MPSSIRSPFCLAAALFSLTAACVDEGQITGPELLDDRAEAPRHIALNHIALNHIALNHIALNGLVGAPETNQAVTQVPLATPSFEPGSPYPELRFALENDDLSRKFMGYLISCALPATSTVVFDAEMDNDYTGLRDAVWTGGLGVCPEWEHGPVGEQCQELVSACLFARVNKYGHWVPLSMRGDGGLNASTMEPSIRSFPQDQWSGATIRSLQAPCPAGTTGFADCGWRAERVITCQKGQLVEVGAGGKQDDCKGATLGSASNDVLLRVTAGVRARDNAAAVPIPLVQYHDDDTTGNKCRSLKPYLSFTCNNNGVYSVMTASYRRSETNTAKVAVRTLPGQPALGFGAREDKVFRQREGAFFGNIFKWYALGIRVYWSPNSNEWRVWDGFTDQARTPQTVVRGTIFQDMFVCSAPEWYTAAAYFHSRLCALPGSAEGCGARYVGHCAASPATGPGVCAYDDSYLASGHGGWNACIDLNGNERHNVISTFLAGQCDVVPDGSVCGTANNPGALP